MCSRPNKCLGSDQNARYPIKTSHPQCICLSSGDMLQGAWRHQLTVVSFRIRLISSGYDLPEFVQEKSRLFARNVLDIQTRSGIQGEKVQCSCYYPAPSVMKIRETIPLHISEECGSEVQSHRRQFTCNSTYRCTQNSAACTLTISVTLQFTNISKS